MKRSEYEQKMTGLQNQIEELKKVEIEEDDKGWKPNYGDEYYYIEGRGYIETDIWQDWGVDTGRYSIGNCFKTQEEAEFMVEKLKVIAELKRFTSKKPWSTRTSQWDLYVEHSDSGEQCKLSINAWSYEQGSEFQFNTRQDAQDAIDAVGEKRILKYYFGVAEEEL